MQYADDFTQVIISKFNTTITQVQKEQHRQHVEDEIRKQNAFEKQWKIKTNIDKFKIITIGFYKAPMINIDNLDIPYSTEIELLGLKFSRNNFYVKQVETSVQRANAEFKKIQRFRLLKTKLKTRLYKTLVLPHLTYPAVPLNICSNTQYKKLQVVQNKAIRWITNTYYRRATKSLKNRTYK